MEVELGAPMYQSIVERKVVTLDKVKLYVRFRRCGIFADRRRTFRVVIDRNNPHYTEKAYKTLSSLQPGDEVYVDGYGEEWNNPRRCNMVERWWNLRFG